jgi:hypothetical protein
MLVNKSIVGGAIWLAIIGVGFSGAVSAQSARQYCEEMYPVDAYEPEERQQYIEECVAVTADSYGESDGGGYYEGTVEDYVETLPEDNRSVEEPAESPEPASDYY